MRSIGVSIITNFHMGKHHHFELANIISEGFAHISISNVCINWTIKLYPFEDQIYVCTVNLGVMILKMVIPITF